MASGNETQLFALTKTNRRRIVVLSALTALYLVLVANWWQVWLRFESPRLNYVFMAFVFASPVILLWIVWTLDRGAPKAIAWILVPVSVASVWLFLGTGLLMAFWIPEVLTSDIDRSFERVRRERIDGESFSVYRTNGGATTSFGVVVRKEGVVFPGLVRVSPICGCYPADDVHLTRIDAETVRCEFPPYGPGRPDAVIVDVAR